MVELEPFLSSAFELLAIPSTAHRPGDLHRALDFVLAYAGADPGDGTGTGTGTGTGPGGPLTVERFDRGGKPSALVYEGGERPEFGVILNGHLDVVPAPGEQFRPRVSDGRLYARGAQDMKVSALAMAAVFRDLVRGLPYPLGLQLVTDEEMGGHDGTRHQLEQGVTAAFAVMGESSGLDITTECKGTVNVVLRAEGRNAHGAYPWLGDNAVLKLHRAIGRIMAKYPVPDAEAWRTTVNVARLDTPNTAFNQVPAQAEAWLDIRFPAGDPDFDGASPDGGSPDGGEDGTLDRYLASFCEPGISTAVRRFDSPAHADTGRPEIAALRDAARRQGFGGDFLRKHGTADARFYRARGLNAVSFGIGGAGQHGPAEYAEINTIVPYYDALSDFLTTLAT